MAKGKGEKILLDQLEALKKQFADTSALEQYQSVIEGIEKAISELNPVQAIKGTEELTKKMAELAEGLQKTLQPTEAFDKALQRSIKTLTGVTDASDTLMGSFAKMAKGQKTLGGIVDETKKSFDKATSGHKIGLSVAQKLVEGTLALAKANDTAMASFNGATGAGGRYNKQIIELEKENRKFGIGAAASAAALQNLIGGLSGFGLMAKDTQSALADEVSELQKLGAAGADTTGVFQSATKTFGMTTDAAEGLTQQAETLAQQLGISVGQAVGDLNRALPQLAVLSGDEVSGAFKRLSEQAIETGLSIDQLTSIADKFMTFESASKAAGNLNAVLGTQMFDTMGLLEAQLEGPQAFIDKLRTDLQASVGDFDSLNVFQKQSIANAAGMSVIEVRNLMNAKAISGEEKKQAKSREDNLKTTMDLMAELKAVGAELTVAFSPVIKGLKIVLSKIATMLELFRKVGEKIPLLGKGIGGGVGTLAGAAVAAKGGKFVANKVSSALGWGGGKLGTRNNPMFVQDVNDKDGGGGSIKGKLRKDIIARLKSTKLGQKMSRFGKFGGSIGPALPPAAKKGLFGGLKGMFKGGAKKFGLKGLGKLGLRALPGIGTAMMAYEAAGLIKKGITGKGLPGTMFQKGTDNYPGGPLMNHMGENGKKELTIPPPGSAIINNENTKALSAAMRGGGQSNGEVLAAIKALADRKIEVNVPEVKAFIGEKDFNRASQKFNGGYGSQPA